LCRSVVDLSAFRACGGAGSCERGSPAGHGWPAECARTDASQKCATLGVDAAPGNPPVTREFVTMARRQSPPNGEESRSSSFSDGRSFARRRTPVPIQSTVICAIQTSRRGPEEPFVHRSMFVVWKWSGSVDGRSLSGNATPLGAPGTRQVTSPVTPTRASSSPAQESRQPCP
jgi:hypothetical protein